MATLEGNTAPVEVFLTKKNIEVSCAIYAEDESLLAAPEVDSVSMRGAQREITAWLAGLGYEPVDRWAWEALEEDSDRGETVRTFRPKRREK